MRGIGPILRSHFLFFPLARLLDASSYRPSLGGQLGARFVRQEFRRNPRNVAQGR
jgi:hypothetical protein